MRRGISGKPTPQPKVDQALQLLEQRKRKKTEDDNLTYDAIAETIGVWSRTTPWRWNHQNMNPDAREQRLKKRVHNQLLSTKAEEIVAGWLVHRHMSFQSTTTQDLQFFLSDVWRIEVKKSWISKFLKRNHLSYRSVGRATPAELNASSQEEALEFLREVHSLKKKPSQILCVDKTSLTCDPATLKEIAPTGR